MRYTTLGRTGISATRTAFGALPIQRLSDDGAVTILRAAADAGINYFDTARAYTDSEKKIGMAFGGSREGIVIATKTGAKTAAALEADLSASLENLKVDAIDVYQFHNPPFVPVPGGEDGLYDAAVRARDAGKIRFIGITQHTLDLAFEAVNSGLYDLLQYPFNHLASEREEQLVNLCREKGVGFVAMKALSGGLITDASIPFMYISQFENVVPIWGLQNMWELEQLVGFEAEPPVMDEAMRERMRADREELVGAFCRSCGYCLPCPVGIPIHNANRMKQLMSRSPVDQWLTEEWREGMARIENCTKCGLCSSRCPYHLKPYETIPAQLEYYREVLRERGLC